MLAGVAEGVRERKETGRGADYLCVCAPPRVFARARLFRCARALRRLLVREPDGGVGGCCFSVDCLVAACDGEAVVCGAPAVDAGV